MKVLGIVGAIGHGKSTAAGYLERIHGYTRGSFAEALKRTCLQLFGPLGAERRHFYGSQADKAEPIPALGGTTGRRILERVGTDGFRAVYADVWVRYALEVEYSCVERLVFEDVRFPNEAEAIHHHGGHIIRVTAEGKPALDTGHASNEAWRSILPDFDVVVENGDLPGLLARVNNVAVITHQLGQK